MTDRYEKIRKALAKGPMQGPWGATLRDLLAERDALAAEVEALRAEVHRLQQQYDERTACMIVHRGQALACSDAVRAAYFDALAQQSAAVDGLAARLVDELDGLMSESDGVSGLHLNGDVATWEELLPGGRFERLSSLDELREALATQQPSVAPVGVEGMQRRLDREESDHGRTIDQRDAAIDQARGKAGQEVGE